MMASLYRNHLRSFPEQLTPSCVTIHRSFQRWGGRGGAPASTRSSTRPATRTEPVGRGRPDAVIVAGMGGSGLAGDLLAHFAHRLRLPVPVVVWKSFGLPPLPFRNPLIIAVSFSGETSETRSAFQVAHTRGYLRGAVAAGGSLGRRARRDRVPYATFTPPVHLTPREGIGYTYYALVALLRLWFPKVRNPDLSRTVRPRSLERRAERVARSIGSRSLFLFAPTSYTPVGYLWKAVLNETAKRPANLSILPEASHNSIMGFSKRSKRAVAVFLSDPAAKPDERWVTRVFQNLVAREGVSVISVLLPGTSVEERTWNGVLLGHYTALSLAETAGENPVATPLIAKLKAQLRQRGR